MWGSIYLTKSCWFKIWVLCLCDQFLLIILQVFILLSQIYRWWPLESVVTNRNIIKNMFFQWKAVVMFVKCCPDHFWQGSWFTDVDRHDQWVLTEMENVKTLTSNKHSLQRFRSSQVSFSDSPKIIARIFLPYLWHITTLWVLTKERGLGMPGLQWSQKDIPVMNKKL